MHPLCPGKQLNCHCSDNTFGLEPDKQDKQDKLTKLIWLLIDNRGEPGRMLERVLTDPSLWFSYGFRIMILKQDSTYSTVCIIYISREKTDRRAQVKQVKLYAARPRQTWLESGEDSSSPKSRTLQGHAVVTVTTTLSL
jgi:hypothetical protein